jgi:hypothetical protein
LASNLEKGFGRGMIRNTNSQSNEILFFTDFEIRQTTIQIDKIYLKEEHFDIIPFRQTFKQKY